MQKPVLIIGGGIAGLAAALTLARIGYRSVVQERNAQFQAVGAGIQLGPNALRLIDRLGLLDQLQAFACTTHSVWIKSLHTGQAIAQIDQRLLAQRYGYPNLAIHRADLQRVLVEAARQEPLIAIQLGSRTTIGESIQSDQWSAIVGADGLWSAARQWVVGSSPRISGNTDEPDANHFLQQPNYTGKVALRALIPSALLNAKVQPVTTDRPSFNALKHVGLWLGAHRHVVHYPVQQGQSLNMIAMAQLPEDQAREWTRSTTNDDAKNPNAAWSRRVPRDKALALFDGSDSALSDILKLAPTFDYWPLFDRPSLNVFHRDRVCLIGDAAHPLQAHLAQGASLAIEDAFVLAGCIERANSIETAFQAFSRARVARCAHAQAKARLYGNIYQASGLTAMGRNLFLKSPLAKANAAGMDWLYRGIDDELLPSSLQKNTAQPEA
jgi:2-polyprenyl-6-methoxyphenol hydroxylase-like FAD-dependent oxidoreductase